jgi:hypothetical protein
MKHKRRRVRPTLLSCKKLSRTARWSRQDYDDLEQNLAHSQYEGSADMALIGLRRCCVMDNWNPKLVANPEPSAWKFPQLRRVPCGYLIRF